MTADGTLVLPDTTVVDKELRTAAAAGEAGALRDAVRNWAEHCVPEQWLSAALANDLDRLHRVRSPQDYRAWYPVLGRSGLVVAAWPERFGGLGLSPELVHVVQAELRRYRLTTLNIIGIALAAPTLLEFGTDEQCERLLPAIATNAETWCQLFSEPGAGSDLAGLATRATQSGERWTVNGQKVWSSFASDAARGILLARTDPSVPKHQGITAFALDLRQPGVTVRPLRKISGDAEFSEVFFEQAIVSDADRIGHIGQGWEVARRVLKHERAMLSGAGSGLRERTSGSSIDRLVGLACAGPAGRRVIDDPVQADIVARLYVENLAVRTTNARNRESGGRAIDPALMKVMSSEHNQRLQMGTVDVFGARALAHAEDDEEAGRLVFGFLRSRGDTIGGGTSEVHRNYVAERTLGMPKDPFSDKSIPWREIKRGP
ncbi:acyl-CoA dehydrogenase family protein [Nocardia sp. NPDC052278]|uniref:acyl-CoA dehydrogenase family protein n=1 Tax=unclassified Nocardia TaxID=2637762 RepID=UPI0036A513FE